MVVKHISMGETLPIGVLFLLCFYLILGEALPRGVMRTWPPKQDWLSCCTQLLVCVHILWTFLIYCLKHELDY